MSKRSSVRISDGRSFITIHENRSMFSKTKSRRPSGREAKFVQELGKRQGRFSRKPRSVVQMGQEVLNSD